MLSIYLLRPAMMIWRSGQRLERAVAVDPPTRPVPPSTKTRAFLDLYGSWTLYSLSWVAQANANPLVLFKCNKARAITINGLTNLLLSPCPWDSCNSNSLILLSVYRWWYRALSHVRDVASYGPNTCECGIYQKDWNLNNFRTRPSPIWGWWFVGLEKLENFRTRPSPNVQLQLSLSKFKMLQFHPNNFN